MINVTNLRNGMYFQEDGTPYQVISYDHMKVGRGGATVKVKVRNLQSGSMTTQTFQSGRKVEEADLDQVVGTFLYRTNTDYVFDADDEEIEIALDRAKQEGSFLKKGVEVRIMFYKGKPIAISLPIKVEYKVKEAPPDARGNSANASTKEVVIENNLKVKAPMFIKTGDHIIVDTRSGDYISRA